eukprot:m.362964 g.362964  ORF g.362964 m.362964 type:complete len:899 (+) comp20796_c0_seq1:178-2874(+)
MGRSGKRRKIVSPVADSSDAIVDPNTGVPVGEFHQQDADGMSDETTVGSGTMPNKKRKRKQNTHSMLVSDSMSWKEFDVDNTVMLDFASQGFCGLEELTEYPDLHHVQPLSVDSDAIEEVATQPCASIPEDDSQATMSDIPTSKKKKNKKKKKKERNPDDALADVQAPGTLIDADDTGPIDVFAEPSAEPADTQDAEIKVGNSAKSDAKKKKKKNKTDSRKAAKADAVLAEDTSDQSRALEKSIGDKGSKKEKKRNTAQTVQDDGAPDDDEALASAMEHWRHLALPGPIVRGLSDLGFTAPTPVQEAAIPDAYHHRRDVVCAAETGSGKTLAFGVPVLSHLCELQAAGQLEAGTLACLIMLPTRELALQVHQSIAAVAKHTALRVACIVGGLAAVKQNRLLKKRPEIVVATPGRLWELLSTGEAHFQKLKALRFLVVDEADRMVDKGHFKEFKQILGIIEGDVQQEDGLVSSQTTQLDASAIQTLHRTKNPAGEGTEPEATEDPTEGNHAENDTPQNPSEGNPAGVADASAVAATEKHNEAVKVPAKSTARQNLIFSATLFLDKLGGRARVGGRTKQVKAQSAEDNLKYIASLCGVRAGHATINLSAGTKQVAQTLTEAKISCATDEKDHYLYYFLTKYPGRTLVFANSISCIRRLLSIFKVLQLPVYGLHASMQQRQRLKSLDRFKSQAKSVLVATDVAARGLDITGIEHVIHYQLPRDTETYVHRSGRTARSSRAGLAVALVGPEDVSNYRRVIHGLNSGKELGTFPVERRFMADISKRMQLAREIDKIERSGRKDTAEESWFVKNAREMDIELDEDMMGIELDTSGAGDSEREKHKAKALRQKLTQLLRNPLSDGVRKSKLVIASKHKGRDHLIEVDNTSGAAITAAEGADARPQ